jgi:hypothetical protein
VYRELLSVSREYSAMNSANNSVDTPANSNAGARRPASIINRARAIAAIDIGSSNTLKLDSEKSTAPKGCDNSTLVSDTVVDAVIPDRKNNTRNAKHAGAARLDVRNPA